MLKGVSDRLIAKYVQAEYDEFWEHDAQRQPFCREKHCDGERFKGSVYCPAHLTEILCHTSEAIST